MTDTPFGFGTSGTALADTDIPQEMLGDDGNFQFDEPTGGKFPPRLTPGPVHFRFEPTAYEEQDNSTDSAKASVHVLRNGKIPKITWTGHVQVADLQPGRLLKDSGESEVAVRFNEATGFKSKKMAEKGVASDVERLYTTLGLVAEIGKPKSTDGMTEAVRAAGNRYGHGKVGWSVGFKLPVPTADGRKYEVFSTSPNTKRGEKPWPRGADNQLLTEITFNGETKFAREEITDVYPPRKPKTT